MIWFFKNTARVDHERRAIAALAENAPWLSDLVWRLDQSVRLCVDADVHVEEAVFPITLKYPEFYPHTPPSVSPRVDLGQRWSDHQYGPGGELCLEYGPDNWVAELTGADVLRSPIVCLLASTSATMRREKPSRPAIKQLSARTFDQPAFASFSRQASPPLLVCCRPAR